MTVWTIVSLMYVDMSCYVLNTEGNPYSISSVLESRDVFGCPLVGIGSDEVANCCLVRQGLNFKYFNSVRSSYVPS